MKGSWKTKPVMSILSDPLVVNTSPLLALDACNQIELLRLLYGRVLVPKEVNKELSVGKNRPLLPGGLTAAHRSWIEVVQVTHPPKASLLAELDSGEAEVITLALELRASTVLIDERIGWRVAIREGLIPIGSVGIILLAKKKGLIAEVKTQFHEMRSRGIYLSQRVIDAAIIQAGETA